MRMLYVEKPNAHQITISIGGFAPPGSVAVTRGRAEDVCGRAMIRHAVAQVKAMREPVTCGESVARVHDAAYCVEHWNARRPVGQPVTVLKDDGTSVVTKTRSPAWALPSGPAVVMVDGIAGGYLLTRVQPIGRTT